MKTDQDQTDFTNGDDPLKMRNVTGSKRNGWNIAADTVYTLSPTTTFNIRGSYYMAEDKRDYPEMADDREGLYGPLEEHDVVEGRESTDYMAGRPLLYFPHIVVDNNNYGRFGVQNFWYQQPSGYSLHGRFTKYFTKHWLKAGTEVRWKRGECRALLFRRLPFLLPGNRQGYGQGRGANRPPLGQLPARGHQSVGVKRPVQRASIREHGDVRLLPSGRLQSEPESDA